MPLSVSLTRVCGLQVPSRTVDGRSGNGNTGCFFINYHHHLLILVMTIMVMMSGIWSYHRKYSERRVRKRKTTTTTTTKRLLIMTLRIIMIRTLKRFKGMLFIRTKHSMRIFGVISFIKIQTTLKQQLYCKKKKK